NVAPTGPGVGQPSPPGDITTEFANAQTARSEAEARAALVRDKVAAGNAELLPDAQRSPLIQNLAQQRERVKRQIGELSATLLPEHPRMRQLQADLDGLERQIKSEVGKFVEGVDKVAKAAAVREEAIRKTIEDARARTTGPGDSAVTLPDLEAVAKTK